MPDLPDNRLELSNWIRDNVTVDPVTGCWLWKHGCGGGGYAQANIDGKVRTVYAVVYERLIGPVPAGYELAHKCHKKLCIRPSSQHVRPATHAQNMRDSYNVGTLIQVGERNGNCKLSDLHCREIVERFQSGQSQRYIADVFGVGATQVRRIVKGEQRCHHSRSH